MLTSRADAVAAACTGCRDVHARRRSGGRREQMPRGVGRATRKGVCGSTKAGGIACCGKGCVVSLCPRPELSDESVKFRAEEVDGLESKWSRRSTIAVLSRTSDFALEVPIMFQEKSEMNVEIV